MNIVITMAGNGVRFKNAGYQEPKYKIKVCGKTIFEWAMESLTGFNKVENLKYIFIARKGEDAKKFILEKMQKHNIKDVEVIEIDYLTEGQATSAMLAKSKWDEKDELIIYNIDTYVESDNMKYEDIRGDGFIPCFNAPGDHWSFVKTDKDGNTIEIREKERISDNCTIGLYYFKSCELYEKIYNEYYSDNNNIEKSEKYVAPLYNHMVKKGYVINIQNLPEGVVHVLGTPEEVKEFETTYTKK